MAQETTNPLQGTVWQVPLMNDLGYGYVRYIYPTEFNPIAWGILIYIYDYRSDVSQPKLEVSSFLEKDYLVAPIVTFGRPPQRGVNRWIKLGTLPINSFERIPPDFKLGYGEYPETMSYGVIKDMYPNEVVDKAFDWQEVKHLSVWNHVNLKVICHRITMEWMRKIGLNYFSYTNEGVTVSFLHEQKQQVKSTVLWSGVPLSNRGKVVVSQ